MNGKDKKHDQHMSQHAVDDVADLQHESRHDREQSHHHAHHEEQEARANTEEAAAIVTRADVAELIKNVKDLNNKLANQHIEQSKKRRKLAAYLAIYTLVVAYAVGAMVDEHVKNCMTFGTVPSERTRLICNVTMPLHDHPIGGVTDEQLNRAVERVIELRQDQDE